jgi:hypothetical protein
VRFVAAALVLLVIVVIVLAVAVIVTQSMGSRRRRWEIEERSDGKSVSVYAAKQGDEELLLGSVPVSDPGFDMRLYELRAEAEERVRVLNDRGFR